jgi:TrmH family RNA methyltransferase
VFFITTPKAVEPPARIEQNSLWLDRVQDPGNVGVLLRTAAAAGIQHIYLSPGCAAAWSSKVLRSAQGAHFAASIYEQADLATANKKRDIPLLATTLADATSLYEDTLPDQCVWLFGNEGQGVDARLLDLADRRVFIPQAPNVESLNVAAAAAICLFEHRRQRLAASR